MITLLKLCFEEISSFLLNGVVFPRFRFGKRYIISSVNNFFNFEDKNYFMGIPTTYTRYFDSSYQLQSLRKLSITNETVDSKRKYGFVIDHCHWSTRNDKFCIFIFIKLARINPCKEFYKIISKLISCKFLFVNCSSDPLLI